MTLDKLNELKSIYPEKWAAYKKASPENADYLFCQWAIYRTPEGQDVIEDYLTKTGK